MKPSSRRGDRTNESVAPHYLNNARPCACGHREGVHYVLSEECSAEGCACAPVLPAPPPLPGAAS